MRLYARTIVGVCVLAFGSNVALASDPQHLEGTWIGERSGAEVVWQFGAEGQLRLEGRRATWVVRSDSLLVEFEPPDGTGSTSERAVYRFVASDPQLGHRRLFVYGFDLGQIGVLLTRQVSEEELARLQSAVKVGPGVVPSSEAGPPPGSRPARTAPSSQRQ